MEDERLAATERENQKLKGALDEAAKKREQVPPQLERFRFAHAAVR